MRLSYVIVTRNRRERLLHTLEQLHAHASSAHGRSEVWVVDNASTDGTAAAVRRAFPRVHVIELDRNQGMPARNAALRRANGRYVVLLDDDSYPLGDAVERSAAYLDESPRTGAVVGRVLLPDGRPEAPALPTVISGCATCLRAQALEQVNYFDEGFFQEAETFDLSLRLWEAGWSVERFEDVVYRHDAEPTDRDGGVKVRMRMRNHLLLAERFLPQDLRRAYRADWAQQQQAAADHAGYAAAAQRGAREAQRAAWGQRLAGRRTLSPMAIEQVFALEQQALAVPLWAAAHRVRRVVIADLRPNTYATWRACVEADLSLSAIAGGGAAFDSLTYRGTPVVDDASALRCEPEGIILANTNPAEVGARYEALRRRYRGPILQLWHPRELSDDAVAPGADEARTGARIHAA